MNEIGVIIIGGHVQGLGVLRIFGRNRIPCYVLDTDTINIAKHSKYCKKFIKIDQNLDFVQFLINLCKEYNLVHWLLIPTDDYYVSILSRNKNMLKNYYNISVDDWDIIEKCYNKRLTYKIVFELGIDMPKTYFPNSYDELDSEDVGYPCIIKPAVMHKLYGQIKKKVLVCNDRADLKLNYKKVISYIPADEVIVQEIIPGDSCNQYSACFFFDRNKPIVSLLARRKRQYPMDFGSCTSFAETINDTLLIENAEKILSKINYWGICEVEFKRDPRDGKYKFLEINPRTWKWHSISTKSESPFLMSIFNYIYNKKPIIKNDWVLCCWKDLILDTVVLIKSLFNLGRRSCSDGCENTWSKNIAYAVYDTSDLKPFLYEILYLPYLFVKR